MHFGTLAEVQAGIATRRVKWDRDYQVKHGITTGPAEGLSEAEVEKLSHLAKRIYRALHMCGFARLDFRMRNDGKVFLLEANANPDLRGFRRISGVGRARLQKAYWPYCQPGPVV
jgi:D-alanine-D-alanine ligase